MRIRRVRLRRGRPHGERRPEKLDDTRTPSPRSRALSVAVARALMARGVEPAAVLGFSLGQMSALAVSGMLSTRRPSRS